MFSPNSPVYEGATLLFPQGPGMLIPYEYTGWQDENLASKTSAWIGTPLTTSPIYDVKGPDLVKFFNSICVNDFSGLSEKGIRHAIICNEKGQILTDSVVHKVAEDRIRTYWLNPCIEYLLKESGMKVEGINMAGKLFFIQIEGEKSLEITETACESDLHDIKFGTHRMAKIAGVEVRILRLGMSGNLAYEVHGDIKDFDVVYHEIWEAGKQFGAKKLGLYSYSLFNHTEAGFPNINLHYPLPWYEDPGFAKYLADKPMLGFYNLNRRLRGSVGNDLEIRFVTPYDNGWGSRVKFNHEFTGKAALEKISKNPPRKIVTLEWNADDVGAVYATQFRGKAEACERIDTPTEIAFQDNMTGGPGEGFIYRADKVLVDGKQIGISSGRVVSPYYHTMISLAYIAPEYAVEGKELTLVWGTPGTPQKDIRVKVARYPYLDPSFVRNEKRDVSDIPRKYKVQN
jgi:glycine cleavage system aminomethyltransferase T